MSTPLPPPRKSGEPPRIAAVQGRRPLPPPPSAAPDGPSMAALLRQLAVFLVLGGGLAIGIWTYVKGVREEGKQVQNATDTLRAMADALWLRESFATQLPAVNEEAEAELPKLMLTISGLKAKLKPDERIDMFVAPIVRGMREVTWRDKSNKVLLNVHFRVQDDGGFKFLTFTTDPTVKPAEVAAAGTPNVSPATGAATAAAAEPGTDAEVKELIEKLKKETSEPPAPVAPPAPPPVPPGLRPASPVPPPAAPPPATSPATPATPAIPPATGPANPPVRPPATPPATAPATPPANLQGTPSPPDGTGLRNP